MSSSLASLQQHFDRRIAHGREMVRELGARLGLDLVDEPPDNIVEEVDVFVVVAAGTIKKESRDALECLDPLLTRAVLNDFFKLGDQ